MNRIDIKERAKAQLGNSVFAPNWLYAVLTLVVVSIISGAVGSVPLIGSIVALIIAGPMSAGTSFLFLKQARDHEKMYVGDVFKGFSDDFKGNMVLGILSTIYVFLWSLLFVVPGIIKTYAYSMIFYIKNDHPEYDYKMCLDESQRIMNGHKMELFVLQLSFIGWMIVGALCLGIGTFWAAAYMSAATAQFYEDIKNS